MNPTFLPRLRLNDALAALGIRAYQGGRIKVCRAANVVAFSKAICRSHLTAYDF